ncbi:MAG: YvcK family protein [Candidatus Wallbacteria bacterium]|nr:YvcK family protein [Candidatus Wallbacteria bacterium]
MAERTRRPPARPKRTPVRRRGAPRIVCIGGGSGPSLIVKTVPEHLDTFTAIVTVTDSGSSTGIIRSNFGIAAPGDIRATLSVMSRMSGTEDILPRLMEYRFQPQETGQLSNMAFGNLMLAAICKLTGNIKTAIMAMERILSVRGRVLPVSLSNTDLAAELEDGTVVHGEVNVRGRDKPPIRRLFLADETARADLEVEEAIRGADFVFLGPGNLYTSVLACLIFPYIQRALAECRGKRIFICNTTSSPGQTEGFSAARHVEVLMKYLVPGSLDHVVLNTERPSERVIAEYREHGAEFIPVTRRDLSAVRALGIEPIAEPIVEPEPNGGPRKLHKVDTIRHDPAKLRAALRRAVGL